MFSVKSMMRSAGAVGCALVLLGSGASAAVAAPATFSSTGPGEWVASSTDLVKLSWGTMPWQNRTCTSGGIGNGGTTNTAGQGALVLFNMVQYTLNCTDGYARTFQTTIALSGPAQASVSGGVYSLSAPRLVVKDPGAYGSGLVPLTNPVSFSAPFTNGTTGFYGANPSRWTFSNTLVAYAVDSFYGGPGAVPVRLTGSFNAGHFAPLTLS